MKRLPIVLSATALVVAVFGSTPVGHAVASQVPPFAKKADYAKRAGTAATLNGIKASKQPRAGQLVPLGKDGKFPASVAVGGPAGPQGPKGDSGDRGQAGPRGATGPQGDRGPAGPTGSRGVSGWEYQTRRLDVRPNSIEGQLAFCSGQRKPLGGGLAPVQHYTDTRILESAPEVERRAWSAFVHNAGTATRTYYVWVICADVA